MRVCTAEIVSSGSFVIYIAVVVDVAVVGNWGTLLIVIPVVEQAIVSFYIAAFPWEYRMSLCY